MPSSITSPNAVTEAAGVSIGPLNQLVPDQACSDASGGYAIYITISPSFGRGHSFTDISGKGALSARGAETTTVSP